MRRYLRLGTMTLAVAAILNLQSSFAQDLFWLGGNGDWEEPGQWSTMPGGFGGDGPPNAFDRANFTNTSGGPFTVLFGEDGAANGIDFTVDNVAYAFDVGGNILNVSNDIRFSAGNAENNSLTIANGSTSAESISSVGGGTGVSLITIASGMNVRLRRTPDMFGVGQAVLNVDGLNAEIAIEGTVLLDNTDGTLPVARVNDNGKLLIDGGTLTNEGDLVISVDPSEPGGQLMVQNVGFANVLGSTNIGMNGTAEVELVSAGNLTTHGATILGEGADGDGSVSVSEAFSDWLISGPLTIGGAGMGEVAVFDGGEVEVDEATATVTVGEQASGNGLISIGAAGTFSTLGSVFLGGTSSAAGGTGELSVAATGTASVNGQLKVWGQGRLNADGGNVTAGQIVVTSGGELNIDNGGTVEATNVALHASSTLNLIDGELAIVGPGGTFTPNSASFSFGSTTAQPVVRLENASTFVDNWNIGVLAGSEAKTIVEGDAGANLNATFDINIGGSFAAANGELEVLDGGLVSAGDDIIIANTTGSSGTVTVQGVSTGGQRSILRNSATGSDEEIEIGRRGVGVLDVLDGGLVQSLNNVSIGSLTEGNGTVNVGGATGPTNSLISVSNDLAVGGLASFDFPGGKGQLNIHELGQVTVTDLTKIYSADTVDVHDGGTLTTGRLQIAGGELIDRGVTNVQGTTAVEMNGLLTLDGGEFVAQDDVIVDNGATLRGHGSISTPTFVEIGGKVIPGLSTGVLTVMGNFDLLSTAATAVELGGTTAGSGYDQIVVTGGANLDGELVVQLINGFTLSPGNAFKILDAGGSLSGMFDFLAEGALVGNFGGTELFITYQGGDDNHDVVLFTEGSNLPGDYNGDGTVDAADYSVWRDHLGALDEAALAGNGDGMNGVDQGDYELWVTNFGNTSGSGSLSNASVPEPTGVLLSCIGLVGGTIGYRRRIRSEKSSRSA